MKKLAIVFIALLVAGSAFAEKVPAHATAQLGGTLTITNRDDDFDFDFTGEGGMVALVSGPLTGTISAALGEFYMMMESTSYTWGADFGMLFAAEDLSVVPFQVGGYSTYGDVKVDWPTDGGDEVGALSGGLVTFGEFDVTGLYCFIGNLYSGGGINNWVGNIATTGSVVGNDDTSFGAVKALFN